MSLMQSFELEIRATRGTFQVYRGRFRSRVVASLALLKSTRMYRAIFGVFEIHVKLEDISHTSFVSLVFSLQFSSFRAALRVLSETESSHRISHRSELSSSSESSQIWIYCARAFHNGANRWSRCFVFRSSLISLSFSLFLLHCFGQQLSSSTVSILAFDHSHSLENLRETRGERRTADEIPRIDEISRGSYDDRDRSIRSTSLPLDRQHSRPRGTLADGIGRSRGKPILHGRTRSRGRRSRIADRD